MTYEGQVARASRSCTGFVTGKRTITRNRATEPDKREEGKIDNDGYRGRVWRGGTPQDVIEQMDRDLGPVPDVDYQIVE